MKKKFLFQVTSRLNTFFSPKNTVQYRNPLRETQQADTSLNDKLFHCIITHQSTSPKKKKKPRMKNEFPYFFYVLPFTFRLIYNSMLANYVVCDNNHKFSDDLCYL